MTVYFHRGTERRTTVVRWVDRPGFYVRRLSGRFLTDRGGWAKRRDWAQRFPTAEAACHAAGQANLNALEFEVCENLGMRGVQGVPK